MLRAGLDGCADGLADGRLTTDSLQITRAARTGSGRWPEPAHSWIHPGQWPAEAEEME